MTWPPTDWVLTVAIVGAIVGLIVAGVIFVRVAMRLRTAFAEQLHTLPGGGFFKRLKQFLLFAVAVVAHLLIAGVMLIYMFAALRFLVRVFF